MANNQAAKRRRLSQSNFVVPCDECIRIQLKLIKAEGLIEFLTAKCNKQAEKIKHQSNQIKSYEIQTKKLMKKKMQLEDKLTQIEIPVSCRYKIYMTVF